MCVKTHANIRPVTRSSLLHSRSLLLLPTCSAFTPGLSSLLAKTRTTIPLDLKIRHVSCSWPWPQLTPSPNPEAQEKNPADMEVLLSLSVLILDTNRDIHPPSLCKKFPETVILIVTLTSDSAKAILGFSRISDCVAQNAHLLDWSLMGSEIFIMYLSYILYLHCWLFNFLKIML